MRIKDKANVIHVTKIALILSVRLVVMGVKGFAPVLAFVEPVTGLFF